MTSKSSIIIDCHCHVGHGDGLTGPWDITASLDKYLYRAKEAGIDQTVLFSVFHSDYVKANREVGEIVLRNPERFYGFAFINAQRDQRRIYSMVKEAVEVYGFCGIKVHCHDAPITREVCETARKFSLPVLYDVKGKVSVVELLATEYPDVSFIIPHLGSFADDWRAHVALIDQLERHSNIFTDTSGIRRYDYIEQALKRAGAEKILFGTDGPWLHPAVELEKIFSLRLTQVKEDLILGGNFLRLISKVKRRLDFQAV